MGPEKEKNERPVSEEELLRRELMETAQELERWAKEAKEGGWSTYHVEPMLRRAQKIRMLLAEA